MKKRNPIAVALLPFVTFGIYGLYWQVKTKGEMNSLGATIPTAWLIIIPFVNIWWLWKYSEGVEHVTGGKLNGVLSFILLWLLGCIGAAIVQDSFNNNLAVSGPVDSPDNAAPVVPAESAAPVVPPTEPTTPQAPEAPAEPQTDENNPPAAPTV